MNSGHEGDAIEDARRAIEAHGAGSLLVTDLAPDDLSQILWAGSAAHRRSVAAALERVAAGDVEYLAVRAPNGFPVAVGGIDYERHQGAGTLWQLATHGSLRSLGLGTRLITEAETRIRLRGRSRAVMSVEDDNPRARALYERLGYQPFGRERASWETEDDAGVHHTHVADCTLLGKDLS